MGAKRAPRRRTQVPGTLTLYAAPKGAPEGEEFVVIINRSTYAIHCFGATAEAAWERAEKHLASEPTAEPA